MTDEASKDLIDAPALERWMDERQLPGAGASMEIRFIGGGASNEIFEIKRGGVRMALRRPPRQDPEGSKEGNAPGVPGVFGAARNRCAARSGDCGLRRPKGDGGCVLLPDELRRRVATVPPSGSLAAPLRPGPRSAKGL